MTLKNRVRDADRVFKMYANRLERLTIETLEDFLFHIPSRYEDYSKITPVRYAKPGETVTIRGTVEDIKNEFTRNYKKIQSATIKDASGEIEAVWFNQPFLIKAIHPGDDISLSGTVGWFSRKKVMQSPDYEILNNNAKPIHTGRIIPIYPETHGVSSKWIRRQVFKLLTEYENELKEFMPDELLSKYQLLDYANALWGIHFPAFLDDVDSARKRLAFDELLLIQLAALRRREEWKKKIKGEAMEIEGHKKNIEEFWEKLPFELTGAQKRAIHEILEDMTQEKPMNRLLEGDVGSGKTVVAAIAMYVVFLNEAQSVFMAPTEILAEQHFRTISDLLTPLGVTVGLQTGTRKDLKQEARSKKQEKTHDSKFMIHDSTPDILIGTHAVLSKDVKFEKLGLVVIDEQQRFGVEQRSIIREKGKNPHLLTMTATPIPRTVALTLYGDLDLSFLDEMPKGRKIIKTWLVPSEKRESGYQWIEKQITEQGTQAFIVCPFIEESESMTTVKSAIKEFEHLQKNVFKKLTLGLLHGKMKAKEKDEILKKFGDRKIDILVATPVVEVGIDFPNATIMVIEAAQRFGLAALHQLRGRVGRGDMQSYCLLFTESANAKTSERLKCMEQTNIGAELAELDLKMRGPGDVFGTKQHGIPNLKIAHFSDFTLIEQTRKEAQNLLPKLNNYPQLKQKLEDISISHIPPD